MRFDGSDVTEATGFDSDVLSAVGMARRGDLLCSIAMMILLGLLMCSVVRAGPLPSGLSDLQDIPALSEIECPKTGAKPLTADSPPEVEGLPKGATLTYAQALDDLKDALEGSVSPEAIKALDSLDLIQNKLTTFPIVNRNKKLRQLTLSENAITLERDKIKKNKSLTNLVLRQEAVN